MGVTVSVRTGARQVVVSLGGVIDLATRETVRDALASAAELARLVVVDLRDVTFLDSTGLGVLVGARRRVRASGGTMLVVNLRPAVRRVFEIAGLLEALDVRSFESATRTTPRPLPRQSPGQQREPANGAV